MKVIKRTGLRVLDFDTECRPMHYSEWRPESQFTAIAWSWVGEDEVHCVTLNQDLSNEREMLLLFMAAFDYADIVTGHYIRKHDLPLLTEHCVRAEIALPKAVLTSDTMDLVKVKALGKSQQNLSETFGLGAEKHSMSGAAWRAANQLTPAGTADARERVVSDVIQHKALRASLLKRGLLKAPKLWRP